MMVRNEDLGLSLSLGSSQNHRAEPQPSPFILSQRSHWTDLLSCPQGRSPVHLRGIDVNRPPAMERESDEEAGASSPNSTLSSVSGKRGDRDRGNELMILGGGAGEDLDMERGSSRGGLSDEEDGEGSRKKLRLSKDQSAILEESFKDHSTLNPKQKQALAKQLNLRPRQVEVWFQNRRARTKLKQTEVDCEFLKRCCENLTEENRRLQKEVAELRALKLSPQFYMHMTPPTTLTMCPSCERVAVSNNNNTTTARTGGAAAGGGSPAAAPAAEQHYHHHHQRAAFPLAAAGMPTPWAPVPLRSSFVDVHPQRLV